MRKKKPPEQRKSVKIEVLITPDLAQRIRNAQRDRKIATMSTFARMLIEAGLTVHP